ncbi:cysteinyl-tRNA synthetase [Vermiconidia calcicola]|uniref:Cysteinyl-tRNA synthetase n=1 Tax=Vermiconidia calcicola TaxID=1690605 RepID=A0ACC3NB79_9PEZI|nr:cysteinyl-tRNA synthetase [Vermiconidia calcicola]
MASQPPWQSPPEPSESAKSRLPNLRIYNSLTRTKTPFLPLDKNGRKVGWYACGPTVYDDSHLGHARNYVSTDIIRRILQDYFKFDLQFVMNITDVDDKIILAARQQYLLRQWLEKFRKNNSETTNGDSNDGVDAEVKETTEKAFGAYIKKNLSLMKEDTSAEQFEEESDKAYGHVLQGKSAANDGSPPGDKEAKIKMHLNIARSAASALRSLPSSSSPSVTNGVAALSIDDSAALDDFTAKATGVLLPYIDSLHASTVQGTDHQIFTTLTKRYEDRFFNDMKALNVRYPDKVTRVTDYGPQIVDFVKKIEDNGYAYEHEGSVYYDINAWESSGGAYARLEPWNRNDKELQADGEGSLTTKQTSFKRSAADFALWKASKPGEPSWSSPWGEGRPGWHIECSAMASDILGERFDIHSGGIDLAFPHHDNELAQSEAYWCQNPGEHGQHQWVNYFLHMGHLSISGSKMSKSLKNFTTIKQALADGAWTPRGLRVVFLLGNWRDGLEITGDVVKAGLAWEERVSNFFIRVRDLQNRLGPSSSAANGHANGTSELDKQLSEAQTKFRDALSDSFDTSTAMRVISDLITNYNSTDGKQVPLSTTLAIGKWITEMVHMFGLDPQPAKLQPGQSVAIGWSGIDIPEKAKPFIQPLAQLRDRVREQAIRGGAINLSELGRMEDAETTFSSNQPYANANADFQRTIVGLHKRGAQPKEYLAACDHLRDTILWNLDIYLEDRENLPSLIRPLSQSLRQERKDREAILLQKASAKEKAKADAEAAEREKLEKGKLDPKEMFKNSEEYSAWDADGLPTKDRDGQEVAKSKGKKLRKEWERQKKLHEAFIAARGSGA